MIGSVQPNSDGDGTDESSDEEEIPLALAVVPSPTKAKKVRYYPRVSTLPRIPPPARVNAPAILKTLKKVSLTLNSPQRFRNSNKLEK